MRLISFLLLFLSTAALADFSTTAGIVGVANGGAGLGSLNTYGLLAGGTTSTGNLQQVSGLGTSGQILLSNGAGTLPTWQTLANLTYTGHLLSSQSSPPTATVKSAAGTGASCSVSHATDSAGLITLVSGSIGTPATGDQCDITFNVAYATAPICTLSPANTTAALGLAALAPYVTISTTILSLNAAIAAGTTLTYLYNYRCMQTN